MAFIEFRSVSKRYQRVVALDNVSVSIAEGSCTAVVGPNGSGKTTLIKLLMGLALPDTGKIFFQGADIRGKHAYRQYIAYMPQLSYFPANLRVSELFALLPKLRRQPANPEPLIERFGIHTYLHKRWGALSGGMKQKVSLTLALMFDVPLYVLDEPTNGLDPVATRDLIQLLRSMLNQGKTILFTGHVMAFVERIASHVIFLVEGKKYFEGELKELLARTSTSSLEEAAVHLIMNHAGVQDLQVCPQPVRTES